jgi:hypothetical protein
MWVSKKPTFDLDAEIGRTGARSFYCANGFVVFRSAMPAAPLDALVETIRTDLDAFAGELPRHYGDPVPHARAADGRVTNAIAHPHLVTAPELRRFRQAIRDVYCHAAIAGCLGELDGRRSYAMQGGLLFSISPLTPVHDDSWSCNTFPHGGAFTVWIPLEDVDQFSGPPFVVRWPLDRFMKAGDLGIEFPPEDTPGWSGLAQEQYRQALHVKVKREGMAMIVPTLRRGDVMIWGSLIPYGSLPGNPIDSSRLSLQGIYRPLGVPWGAYEFEAGKHRFGPSLRDERRHNERFMLTLLPGMQW